MRKGPQWSRMFWRDLNKIFFLLIKIYYFAYEDRDEHQHLQAARVQQPDQAAVGGGVCLPCYGEQGHPTCL